MMRRSVSVVAVAGLMLVTGLVAAQERPSVQVGRVQAKPIQVMQLEKMGPLELSRQFEQALKRQDVSGERLAGALEKYRELPEDLQVQLLYVADERHAQASWRNENYTITRLKPKVYADLSRLRLFGLSYFWPDQGAPGAWSFAFGHGFNDNCTVYFDGSPIESNYLDMDVEFFPNSMAFKIPTNATRDQMHDVFVRETGAESRDSSTREYEIVAPRGYRGYHGWQFSNFGRGPNLIPWNLYSDYFGRLAVEYPNGTHRPAADQWYNDVWGRSGTGGNCFGMSVTSMRVRNSELDHMYYDSYFTAPATAQTWVWWYPWNATTRESVQQQQAAQYVQEVAARINELYNTTTAQDVFTRTQSLLTNPTNRPILCYWGPNWGHAICPYSTDVAGDARRIMCYDNNNPYAENESGSVDPDIATVQWGANTFSRGGGTKAICLSFDEATPPDPHLPGAAIDGMAADTVTIAFAPGSRVNQITDENGRQALNADGSPNENPATRIPNSMVFREMVQAPRLQLPRVQRLQVAAAGDQGMLFIIGDSGGKTLTLDVPETAQTRITYFEPGEVFALNTRGVGQVQFESLLNTPRARLQQLGAEASADVRFINSRANGDRLFELGDFENLSGPEVRLIPAPDGSSLDVIGPANLRFNLNISGPVGQGAQQARFANVALQQGAAARLAPDNWNAIGATSLRLQMVNMQNNQILRQETIQRIR
ncbi:MAG: hypothetical protein ACLFU7_10320 [Armatimonadota bacterium]